jgi:alkylation response protein AidB-like acyl-CoA dehydrogenase
VSNRITPETHALVRKTIARFVDKEVIPIANELDNKEKYPFELMRQLGDMGVLGIRYPKWVGGSEGSFTLYCIICEELARGSMSLAAVMAMQSMMSTDFIFNYGTKQHHDEFLRPALKGEKIGAFCLTEPDAGTDLTNVKTFAEKKKDEIVINGLKTWVTNGPVADMYTVFAITDKEKGIRSANFFLVPRKTKGVQISKKFDKIGTRAAVISEVSFNDVKIPLENQLGEDGRGIGNMFKILAKIRTMTAALSLGLARAAFDDSVQYAKERVAFGKPIGKFQAIKLKIGTMATEIEASKHFIYNICDMIERDVNCLNEAAMVKFFVSEVACRAADEATRIFGSYAYSNEYSASRYFRDTRFLLYGGGTSEFLQSYIADQYGFR